MARKPKTTHSLSKREREVYEIVVKLGLASVSDVMKQIKPPPSYSAVRATLRVLVERKFLKHRSEGKRYIYQPVADVTKSRRSEMSRLLSTFFGGSATDAVAALLDVSSKEITEDQYDELIDLIREAKSTNTKDS